MAITLAAIQEALAKQPHRPIKLVDLFPKELTKEGKLILADIDFSRLIMGGDAAFSELSWWDFTDCVLKKCNFSHLRLRECDFSKAEVETSNIFIGTFVCKSCQGITPTKSIESSKVDKEEEKKEEIVRDLRDEEIDWYLSLKTDQEESDDECTTRRVAWLTRIWKEYPQDLMEQKNWNDSTFLSAYRPVLQETTDHEWLQVCSPELIYNFPRAEGWKLHVSVHASDCKKAYAIAFPILHRLNYIFKFLNLSEDPSPRGKQITIYLEKNGRPHITPEQADALLKEIDREFTKAKITPGTFPESDSRTRSPYCSLRNDSMGFNLVKAEYLPADQVGKNNNPCNCPNYYFRLLATPPVVFDLADHFSRFKVDGPFSALSALSCSLISYLREYTMLDTNLMVLLTESEKTLRAAQGYVTEDIKNIFTLIKKLYCEDETIVIKGSYRRNKKIDKQVMKLAAQILVHIQEDNFAFGPHLNLPFRDELLPQDLVTTPGTNQAALLAVINSLIAPFFPAREIPLETQDPDSTKKEESKEEEKPSVEEPSTTKKIIDGLQAFGLYAEQQGQEKQEEELSRPKVSVQGPTGK